MATATRSARPATRPIAQRFDYVVAWGVVQGSADSNKLVNFELCEIQEYSRHSSPAEAIGRRDDLEDNILPRLGYPDGYAIVIVVPHGQIHASVCNQD